jgi:heat shock protein HslJ
VLARAPSTDHDRSVQIPPRLLFALPVAALAAVTFAACGDDGNDISAPSSDDLAGRTFVSTEVSGQTLVEGTNITMSFDDAAVAVVAGCNTLRTGYELDGETLVVDEAMASTLMMCPDDLMAQDQWIADLLAAGPTVALAEDTLTLTSGDVTITLADEASGESANDLQGLAWTMVSLDNADGTLEAPEGAYLSYEDDTVFVATGCNTGSGSAEVADGTVTFGPLMSTLIGCEPDLAAWETAVFAVLAGEVTYEVDGDTLTLTGDGGTLTLEAL